MRVELPSSMDELVYFTKRSFEEGRVTAWARRAKCPECGDALMGKPVRNGKLLVRAKEYECPRCGYSESKEEHEAKLFLEAVYTCPSCGEEGSYKGPYKRKKYKGVTSYIVVCEHCNSEIPLTKKMKDV